MINLRRVYEYYSREDVKNFIFEFSRNREVTGVFESGGFSQRPNFLQYPNDVLAMAKTKVIEFHGSLEHWSKPMSLRSDNYDDLRIGWDLVLDLDCKDTEHGKIAAEAFLWGLRKHGINGASIKYTGGTGFHIGVPWGSFPPEIDYRPTVKRYPELARTMAFFLKEFVRERFEKNLLKKFPAEELSKQTGKPLGKIFTDEGIDPYQVVDVDPILISPRHFFRLPYSLNRNTFLVSLPIKASDVESFRKDQAMPEKVRVREGFMNVHEKEETSMLVAEASDWWAIKSAEEKNRMIDGQMEKLRYLGYKWMDRSDLKSSGIERLPERQKTFVPESLFPPCVKNISAGLQDGRKRSLFILIGFLRACAWNWDQIEKYIIEWNARNKPSLPENNVRYMIRRQKNSGKDLTPPNCANEGWYKNFGVCKPDERCSRIKNPVSYAVRKEPEAPKKKRRSSSKRKS